MDKVLEQLAAQLGTTVEFLWGVMLKQAPISAITDLLQYALLAVACYWCVRWFRWINRQRGDQAGHVIGCSIVSFIVGVVLITAFFSLPTTVTALVHPDYWALQKVLKAVGK